MIDIAAALLYVVVVGGLYFLAQPSAAVVPVVLGVGLAVRRLSLPIVALSGIVAAVIQFANPSWNLQLVVADLAYAALFFVFGANPDVRIRRFGVAAGLVGLVCLPVWMKLTADATSAGSSNTVDIAAVTALAAMVMGGGWVAGYLQLQRRREIQSRLDAQVDVVERQRMALEYEHEVQRSRIAADMHDTVAHSWAVVAAQADGARYAMRANPDAAEQALLVIADTARSTIADLRTILAELRDPDVEGSTPGLEQQQQLFDRMRLTGMRIEESSTGSPDGSGLVLLTAYRLLAESLTNALKHGDLRYPVQVRQDWTDGYDLQVTNTIGTPGDGTGQGVVGMTERARIAGGRLSAGRQGDTWLVTAHIPPPGREPVTPTEPADDRRAQHRPERQTRPKPSTKNRKTPTDQEQVTP